MCTPVFDSVNSHSIIHGRVLQLSGRVKIHRLRHARVLARVDTLYTIYHTYSSNNIQLYTYLYSEHQRYHNQQQNNEMMNDYCYHFTFLFFLLSFH